MIKSQNLATIKSQLLEKEAMALLPKDKENPNPASKILNIRQWMVGDTEINLLETDTVSSTFLLAQKWPFELLNQQRRIIYAFMVGNDTMLGTKGKMGKLGTEKKTPKSTLFLNETLALLNLQLLFRTPKTDQPYVSMLAANSLLTTIKSILHNLGCNLPLHIRWKHDILLDTMKVGEISVKHASTQGKYYTQLNVEVNVKGIPKNFGVYDFQPTFLQKHIQKEIELMELAEQVILNLAKQLSVDENIQKRKEQIRKFYENELIYLGEKVTIFDKHFEHIHYTGKFNGVNETGDALIQGFDKPLADGVMKFDIGAKDYLSLYR